ncbi:unnamed protein product [Effrenium voratum]|nr:unnamed protein product [Effrenium voratum]
MCVQTISAFEEDLGWHKAVLNTLIREGENLDSPVVQTLPMGTFVHVLKKHNRRVKIDYPAAGWTSETTARGEPILMWDEPEAMSKNIWSLPESERSAVLETREVLRVNMAKQKRAQHDELVRQGMISLVTRAKSGDLQKSLEKDFSVENIQRIEKKLAKGIEQVGNATQEVLKALSSNTTDFGVVEDALNGTVLDGSMMKAAKQGEAIVQELAQSTKEEKEQKRKEEFVSASSPRSATSHTA